MVATSSGGVKKQSGALAFWCFFSSLVVLPVAFVFFFQKALVGVHLGSEVLTHSRVNVSFFFFVGPWRGEG